MELELGVSRTALREALRVLAAKGLVAARPKRGTYVCDHGNWRLLDLELIRWRNSVAADSIFLDDLAEARRALEPTIAELAALRRGEADLEAMEQALQRMKLAYEHHDSEAATAADLSFHRALLKASGNELLQQMEAIIITSLDARDRLVHSWSGWQDSTAQHRRVLDAVSERQPAVARDRMLGLIESSGRDARQALHRERA